MKDIKMKKTEADLKGSKDFYEASSDWFYDMYQSQSIWLKRLFVAVIFLALLLIISVLTNFFLFPLKQKVPYLYAFNNATGEVTILGELQPSQLNNNWQMTRFLLFRYVNNRESYDSDNEQVPYQIAWAMSDDTVRNEYDQFINSDKSPYKTLGKQFLISLDKFGASQLNQDTASVRFEKSLIDKNSGTKQVSNEEAIIKWKYDPKPATQKSLDRDPLGFKVTYYKVSQINLDN